ncbi:JmjC domain-containing protein [Brumicola nitratireducens]|uniref:Putative enzyme with RmlC-like domain n=1 Tax=Glaciecola nitratireducens (strain JCM 12485 / KCTC 12276 / FR1064) TaxID=1085623 RepID=G4QH53_GLANF|nr:cupin domain-containing protein [Glaciecola nitratireducens]AEP30241.1 putative enzyme with RmlC-like domain [Glaciecola nitratireducens FR1064]
MIITDFDQAHFLNEYWQKKPCIIRGFIDSFTDPIDEHELAGLAQEDEIDSRVVSCINGQWSAYQGPFDTFDEICTGAWSLLVQGVDRYIDDIDELTQLVSFIPNWRLDDVMISFSNEGAGVGPHSDEYDVFIIQGKGSRRWQVGLPGNYTESVPHPLLKQIDGFSPIIDEILLPGDVVYIPPKHPHNGVALSDCLNYSIGFRAPTSLEILSGLVDENSINPATSARYTDPELITLRAENSKSAAIDLAEITKVKQHLIQLINSEQAENALLQLLSRQSLPSDEALKADYTIEETFEALSQGVSLCRMTGVKPIYAEHQVSDKFVFFIDGNLFAVAKSLRNDFETLLNSREVTVGIELTEDLINKPEFIAVVAELLNVGYWVLLD